MVTKDLTKDSLTTNIWLAWLVFNLIMVASFKLVSHIADYVLQTLAGCSRLSNYKCFGLIGIDRCPFYDCTMYEVGFVREEPRKNKDLNTISGGWTLTHPRFWSGIDRGVYGDQSWLEASADHTRQRPDLPPTVPRMSQTDQRRAQTDRGWAQTDQGNTDWPRMSPDWPRTCPDHTNNYHELTTEIWSVMVLGEGEKMFWHVKFFPQNSRTYQAHCRLPRAVVDCSGHNPGCTTYIARTFKIGTLSTIIHSRSEPNRAEFTVGNIRQELVTHSRLGGGGSRQASLLQAGHWNFCVQHTVTPRLHGLLYLGQGQILRSNQDY